MCIKFIKQMYKKVFYYKILYCVKNKKYFYYFNNFFHMNISFVATKNCLQMYCLYCFVLIVLLFDRPLLVQYAYSVKLYINCMFLKS